MPIGLDTPRMREAWLLWCKYQSQRRKPLKETTVEQQLKELASWGEDRAVKAIEYSVAQSYTGLFEPDEDRSSSERKTERRRRTSQGDNPDWQEPEAEKFDNPGLREAR